jgi:hypothetical protein
MVRTGDKKYLPETLANDREVTESALWQVQHDFASGYRWSALNSLA